VFIVKYVGKSAPVGKVFQQLAMLGKVESGKRFDSPIAGFLNNCAGRLARPGRTCEGGFYTVVGKGKTEVERRFCGAGPFVIGEKVENPHAAGSAGWRTSSNLTETSCETPRSCMVMP